MAGSRAQEGLRGYRQLLRLSLLWLVLLGPASVFAGTIPSGIWLQFAVSGDGAFATGCDPADPAGPFCIGSSGTPSLPLDAPPWTFVAPAGGTELRVTDAFLSGDRFELFDFGVSLGLTSLPMAAGAVDCGDDPALCFTTPGMSTGSFALGAGSHALTLVAASSPDGGTGFLFLGAAVTVAEPGAIALAALALLVLAVLQERRPRR